MRMVDADALMRCIPAEEIASRMAVANAPTIEERKKGEWIWDGESRREYPYKCSECGEIDYYAFLYDTETRAYKQQDNFCPNCGADMRGEENVPDK